MSETKANFTTGEDALAGWHEKLLTGEPPALWAVGEGELAQLEIGPGLVWLLGGAPGSGKTALVMQMTLDALHSTPSLRALVCNVEMHPDELISRQVARASSVDLTTIRHRVLNAAQAEHIDRAIQVLQPLMERIVFVQPPYNLKNIAMTGQEFGANLLVLDYIQRIAPYGDHADNRMAVNSTMDYLRQFAAKCDTGVIVVSSLSRGRDSRGRSTYNATPELASFRESSELEFGADDAFVLQPSVDGEPALLHHLKSRYGATGIIPLDFDGALQRFTPAAGATTRRTHDASPVAADAEQQRRAFAELAALWDRTAPALDEEATDGD
jgi:replicative DNA helicase